MEDRIDLEWLTRITGDPFTDIGGHVIEYLWQQDRFKDKGIEELIEFVADVYVNAWSAKLNVFFLNSTITQPAFKGERKILETIKYYHALIIEKYPAQKAGYCRITGKRGIVFPAGRDNSILSGSSAYVNFHPGFQSGIYLSKEMLIRIFFVPFGSILLGGRVGLIHSNNISVTRFFVQQNCTRNLTGLQTGISKSILKSAFNSPAGSVFSFIDACLDEFKYTFFDEKTESFKTDDVALNIYHFSNFAAEPDIKITELSAPVFKFYVYCSRDIFRREWTDFLKAHYRTNKTKVVFDETGTWQSKEKPLPYEEYRIWYNMVLDALLHNRPIIRFFLKFCSTHGFPFEIIEAYLKIVRNMKDSVIVKLKEIAAFINGQDDEFVKKSIDGLNLAGELKEMRLLILKLIDRNYKLRNQKALLTTDEFEDILSVGSQWREIRDVLLIAIYEGMHQALSNHD